MSSIHLPTTPADAEALEAARLLCEEIMWNTANAPGKHSDHNRAANILAARASAALAELVALINL